MSEVDPIKVDPVEEVDPSKLIRQSNTNLEVENQSKISLRSKQILAKYIDSKNTLKTVLACSEAKINGFLCFG